jgi:hypothetical protein
MRESSIEKKLVSKVRAMGGKAYKFVSPGCIGVPDRIVIFPGGKLVFVEIKAPGQKSRSIQLKRAEELQGLGFKVYAIDSIQGITDLICEMMKP